LFEKYSQRKKQTLDKVHRCDLETLVNESIKRRKAMQENVPEQKISPSVVIITLINGEK
jgi:hypothetical protein